MSLLSRLREKQAGKIATATPETFATQAGVQADTVAIVAIVAVANAQEAMSYTRNPQLSPDPMTHSEESAILEWFAQIGEADPVIISEVIFRCQRDLDARNYFNERSKA